ncbi:MAG: hypothetical protein ACRD2U_02005 [Terriglobales bacterium]
MHPGKSKIRYLALLLQCLLLAPVGVQAQHTVATVGYEQTFPGSEPEHYTISVGADCRASYQSDGKVTEQSAGDESYHYDFTVTPPNCSRIFDLAKRARYFDGAIDSKRKNIAATGTKILSYKDAQRNAKATYNYSPLPEVQDLTALFQDMSATMEFGRRLEYDHRYQKLALDEDLRRMDESAGRSGLQEIPAISPVLQKIVDDPSLMNVIRARAQRMLAASKSGVTGK